MRPRKTHRSAASGPVSMYQLKINLIVLKTHRPIWRRLLVRGDMNLGLLHCVFQVAMGWTNSHLHQFVIEDQRYASASSITDPEEENAELDEEKFTLQEVVPQAKTAFGYDYDFGDSWEHFVVVEKILPPQPVRGPWAVCLDGKRACPPDDVGGIWGYEEFLKAIKNPRHPDHEEMLEWIGRPFNPESFDKDLINRCLRLLSWPSTSVNQLAEILMFRDQPRGWVYAPVAAQKRRQKVSAH